MELPLGVGIRALEPHGDERGSVAEFYRNSWDTGTRPVQWNLVHSRAGVMRGMQVHLRREDYFLLLRGRATVGLRDLRRGSPTEGLAVAVEVNGAAPRALTIPRGVLHGFLFLEDAIHIYALSVPWDPADGYGCRWDDPGLGIRWPAAAAALSPRDEGAPSLPVLLEVLAPFQPLGDLRGPRPPG